jgi:hypothetical protein
MFVEAGAIWQICCQRLQTDKMAGSVAFSPQEKISVISVISV